FHAAGPTAIRHTGILPEPTWLPTKTACAISNSQPLILPAGKVLVNVRQHLPDLSGLAGIRGQFQIGAETFRRLLQTSGLRKHETHQIVTARIRIVRV